MAFVEGAYESDSGQVFLIRHSQAEADAVGVVNSAPTIEAHVYSSGSRRRFGIHARYIRLTRTIGTAPDAFKVTRQLSVPSAADYLAYTIGQAVTYAGQSWTVSAKVDEDMA